jgi:hypothetical protein
LTTTTIGLRSLTASPAIALSCWVTPSERVEDQEDDVGPLDRVERAQAREVLDRTRRALAAALIPAVSISRKG